MVVDKTGIDVLIPKIGHLEIAVVGLVIRIVEGEVLNIVEIRIGFLTSVFAYPDQVDTGTFGIVFGLFTNGLGIGGRLCCGNTIVQFQIIIDGVEFGCDQGFRNPVIKGDLQPPFFRKELPYIDIGHHIIGKGIFPRPFVRDLIDGTEA